MTPPAATKMPVKNLVGIDFYAHQQLVSCISAFESARDAMEVGLNPCGILISAIGGAVAVVNTLNQFEGENRKIKIVAE